MKVVKIKRDALFIAAAGIVFLPACYLLVKQHSAEQAEKQARLKAAQERSDTLTRDALNDRFSSIKKVGNTVILRTRRGWGGVPLSFPPRNSIVLKVGYYFENNTRHQYYSRYTLTGIEKDGIVFHYTSQGNEEQNARQGQVKLPWKR